LLFDHLLDHGRDGEGLLRGYIVGLGYRVTRLQLRASIHRVDPAGPEYRLSEVIQRRRYVSLGPMDCLHIDGNHKLFRWKLVIHGGIDGCTREIVFLKCSDNNRAQTVFSEFLRGCVEYNMIPLNTRTDYVGENVLVYRFMNDVVGNGRTARVGTSQENQRIEQLWRWITEKVSSFYINVFCDMEDMGMNPENENILFCLHYLFIPRINEDLQRFRMSWSHHKIRTALNHSSPRDLYLDYAHLLPAPVLDFDLNYYAATFHDATDYTLHYSQVIVEPSRSSLSPTQFQILKQYVTPLTMKDKMPTFVPSMVYALDVLQWVKAKFQ
jgi:hypothetical protein